MKQWTSQEAADFLVLKIKELNDKFELIPEELEELTEEEVCSIMNVDYDKLRKDLLKLFEEMDKNRRDVTK